MTQIPENFMDLFEKRALGHLATLMPDGSPQVTPVWVDFDGQHVLVNTARGRQKDRNVKLNPAVAIEILDPDNPYRYLQVRGRVTEITEEGADDLIDRLSKKYTGREKYASRRPGEQRVTLKIRPESVDAHG